MTDNERKHLVNFQRECAAHNLPRPDESTLGECAILKPSVSTLGNFFGENAMQLGDIVTTAADCRLVKRAITCDGIWGLEFTDDSETGEPYTAAWFIDFITADDGTISAALFALPADALTDSFRQGWFYAQF